MRRIAIYYENRLGRNDGNPLYVYSALKRREEHETDHIIPDPNSKLDMLGKYDLHIWVDWGEDGLTSILPYQPLYPPGHPLVYWASDTHLGFDYRLETARKADKVFVAQKRAVQDFKEKGVEAEWLPHAVEPLSYCDKDSVQFNDFKATGTPVPYEYASKTYDICFVGHVNSMGRIDALDRMFKEFPNFFWGQRLFNEAAQKYAQSKIVFNYSTKDDLNMRVFEALGSKAFLLTDEVDGIRDLFEDGKHLVLFKTMDEAVEKAKYYLQHDEERDKIAQAGYEHVMKNHTIDKRVDKILEFTAVPA